MDTNDLLNKVKLIGSEVAENAVDAYKKKAAIRKVGAITLDDENQMFKVDRNGKSGGGFC